MLTIKPFTYRVLRMYLHKLIIIIIFVIIINIINISIIISPSEAVISPFKYYPCSRSLSSSWQVRLHEFNHLIPLTHFPLLARNHLNCEFLRERLMMFSKKGTMQMLTHMCSAVIYDQHSFVFSHIFGYLLQRVNFHRRAEIGKLLVGRRQKEDEVENTQCSERICDLHYLVANTGTRYVPYFNVRTD